MVSCPNNVHIMWPCADRNLILSGEILVRKYAGALAALFSQGSGLRPILPVHAVHDFYGAQSMSQHVQGDDLC